MTKNHYACCHIEKFSNKNRGKLTIQYHHVSRISQPINAKEDGYIKQLVGDINVNYRDLVEKRIIELGYGKNGKNLRVDAVIGYDVQLDFSTEFKDKIDLDKWCQVNIEWLKKKFGEDNVLSATLHCDETTPHIHALVTPVVDDKFNSRKIFPNPRSMSILQTEYAKAMEPLGLERGIVLSKTRHEDMRYAQGVVNKALAAELPKPEKSETIEQYYNRANLLYRDSVVKATMLETENKRKKPIIEGLKAKDQYIERLGNVINETVGENADLRNKYDKYYKLDYALTHHPDPEVRRIMQAGIDEMIEWTEECIAKEQTVEIEKES